MEQQSEQKTFQYRHEKEIVRKSDTYILWSDAQSFTFLSLIAWKGHHAYCAQHGDQIFLFVDQQKIILDGADTHSLDQIRCYGDQDSCHILYRHRNSNLVHKIIEIQPSKQKNLTSLEQSPRSLQSSLIDHDLQKILVTWSQKTGIPLTDIQKTIDTYHKNINQLQKKYDDLAEQKKDAETHIKQLTEDIKKITQANQQLVQSHSTKSNTSHQEQQDIVEKLKQQYTALLEQKNVCEKDLSVLRSKHAVLERKLSHYESENKQLQIQLDELKQQTSPSSNMHSDQSVTPSSPTIDQEQLQQKIVSLEAELKQHYQQYQNLTQENKKLTNQIEGSKTVINRLEEEKQKIEQKYNEAQTQNQLLLNEINRYRDALALIKNNAKKSTFGSGYSLSADDYIQITSLA